jgi:hypothetical protein
MKVRYRVSLAAAASPGSLLTLCWREPDSKFQYRAKSTRLASSEMSWRSFGTYRSTSRAVASAQEKRFADSPPEGHGSEPAVSARLPRS